MEFIFEELVMKITYFLAMFYENLTLKILVFWKFCYQKYNGSKSLLKASTAWKIKRQKSFQQKEMFVCQSDIWYWSFLASSRLYKEDKNKILEKYFQNKQVIILRYDFLWPVFATTNTTKL